MISNNLPDNGTLCFIKIISFDFKMIDEDHCVYVKSSKDKFLILSLYVDDILLTSNNKEYVQTIKDIIILQF
jgi:hypothetical protein